MQVEEFLNILSPLIGKEPFFSGVPDSLLRPLCDYLVNVYGTDGPRHVVAANEGNAVALAAGYHLATGRVPVVYMQNSGEGNAVNPIASLLDERVYAIPCFFIVGWRGEPGVHDEPQHVFQGEITVSLLEHLNLRTFILSDDTPEEALIEFVTEASADARAGMSSAVVVRKGALSYGERAKYGNSHTMTREEVIRRVLEASGTDPVVSTTGKASRELFELRESRKEGHGRDFLTVGSMGHASSIALGIALARPQERVWCLDGDGAALMHLGAMAVIGARRPANFVHVVVNNGAHETVGGMPTAMGKVDLGEIAKGCGYPFVLRAETYEELETALRRAKESGTLALVEAFCALGAREDLGRPTTSARQNKIDFMKTLRGEE